MEIITQFGETQGEEDNTICFFLLVGNESVIGTRMLRFDNFREAENNGSAVAVKLFDAACLQGRMPRILLGSLNHDGVVYDSIGIKINIPWDENLINVLSKQLIRWISEERVRLLPDPSLTRKKITIEVLQSALDSIIPETVKNHGGSVTIARYNEQYGEVFIEFGDTCAQPLHEVRDVCSKYKRIGTFDRVKSGLLGLFPHADLVIVPPEDVQNLLPSKDV